MQSQQDEVFQQGKDEIVLHPYTEQVQVREYNSLVPNAKPKLIPIFTPAALATPSTPSTPQKSVALTPICPGPTQNVPLFSKNFQSGNLESSRLLEDGTYHLTISNDCNSKRQSQWFYFSCKGLKKAKFQICGFRKTDSLYNYGMKVCVKEAGLWGRGGDNISYTKEEQGDGYVLNFQYRFRNPNTKTYFAYSFPYTYTDLQNFLSELEKKQLPYYTSESITKTLLNNDVYCLTVTNPNNFVQKQTIVITARVHPGESVSSHIIQGFINTILQNCPQSNSLRNRYIFKIIPMMNPDGVILGNYRLSYSGNDLNRKWKNTSPKLHPQIFHVKKMVLQWNKANKVRLIIDMHGHSRNKNVFFYGCRDNTANTKQLPYLLSKIDPAFSFLNCCFAMQRSKQGTQRIAMNGYLKLPYVYTLESSFCGNQGTEANYTISDLNEIGRKLISGLFIYLSEEIKSGKQSQHNIATLSETTIKRKQLLEDLYQNEELMQAGDEDDDGSSSAPSEGCFRQEQIFKLLKMKGHSKTNSVSKKRSLDSQVRHRPSTTFKRQIMRSPEGDRSLEDDSRVNMMDSSFFLKDFKSKILKKTQPDKSTMTIEKDSRSLQNHSIILRAYKDEDRKANKHQNTLAEQSVQYKRVKKYAEQLIYKNEKRNGRQAFDLEVPAKSMNLRERFAPPPQFFTEPQTLKMQEAKFNIKVVTPSFFPKHKVVIYEDRRKEHTPPYSFSGFQKSIKAKDYLQEKKGDRSIVACIRKKQQHLF